MTAVTSISSISGFKSAAVRERAPSDAHRVRRRRVTPLTPALLVAAANSLVGIEEDSDRARGQIVRAMLRAVHQPADHPWHAAFVAHIGYWSHYDHSANWSSWPLPMTGDANDLARFAAERRVLSTDSPVPGEVFLLWAPARRTFIHCGVIVVVGGAGGSRDCFECTTVEGNTTDGGQLNGRGVHRIVRTLSPGRGDRFIRWVGLDNRNAASEPWSKVEVCLARMRVARAA